MTDQLLTNPQQIHEFDNLELLARQVVEGFIIGLHKSPFHGFSVEFAEHRLYNPGDAIRNIDWKVYARTDKMFIKKYEEETNLRCCVVLDSSSSMYFPENAGQIGAPRLNKLQFSTICGAAIMNILKRQRDAVALAVFSDDVEFQSHARSTTVHQNILTNKMVELLNRRDKVYARNNNDRLKRQTAAARCLHQIAENVHRRSLVVVFSDMFENMEDVEEIFSALQHLRYNKHEVILFHVVDTAHEMEFEFENRPYVFVDLESGDEVKIQPNQVKSFYKEQMSKFFNTLKLRCGQFNIDFVEADINKDFRQVLLPYMLKRNKMNG